MTGGTLPINGSMWIADRWGAYNNTGVAPYWSDDASSTKLPGTNFRISQYVLNFSTLSTSKTTLAASDQLVAYQTIEGSVLRELIDDVHSISILALTNVTGGLKFALSLRDNGATRSLVKLCTITTANQWQLIQLPNIPIFVSGGSWGVLPGSTGYQIGISVACGSTAMTPANDSFQTGNFIGAIGMDNILSKPTNSSLQIAFIQHEPGPVCSIFQDKPFSTNLDECLRYYTKSYNYGVVPGTASSAIGLVNAVVAASQSPVSVPIAFKKIMAKTPTVTGYAYDGTINTVRDATASANKAITSTVFPGDSLFGGFNVTSPNAALWQSQFHYTADTGW